MEETTTRIKITDEISDYFMDKLEKCENMEQLEIIEYFFYEHIEFDKDSWKLLAEIAKLKMMFIVK